MSHPSTRPQDDQQSRIDRPAPALPARESGPSRLTRRTFVALSAAAAGAIAIGSRAKTALAGHIPATPTVKRPPPSDDLVTEQETLLAFRCHGMQLEALSYPITPIGMHYLLIHWDVPRLDGINPYRVTLGGRVRTPLALTLDEIKAGPVVKQPSILECAGNGRALLHPRPIYVPWFFEAIGTYEYTGTPLRPLLERAGLLDDAVEVVFSGWDEGIDLGVRHAFERSMPVEEALRDGVMLAWEANGQPLPPQHGWPLRLVVPDWYGMASVKWLRAITVVNAPFEGVQQKKVYRLTQTADDPGSSVTRKSVRALMQPPGIPDLFTRHRFLPSGSHLLNGMAWSGWGPIARVEVSVDGGTNWADATLDTPVSPYAWTPWRFSWNGASAGEYELVTRGTDAAGNVQPLEPYWTYQGMAQNGVQRIALTVA